MALTRKFLKAMGIEDEKIDEIISAHTETVEALKTERDTAKENAGTLDAVTKERDKLKEDIEALKKTSGDAAKVQAAFDAYKTQIENGKTNERKSALIREALRSAGANETVLDLLTNGIDLTSVELDGEALKDASAIIDPIKTKYAGVFGTIEQGGIGGKTPPQGDTKGKDPDEMTYEEYVKWRKGK